MYAITPSWRLNPEARSQGFVMMGLPSTITFKAAIIVSSSTGIRRRSAPASISITNLRNISTTAKPLTRQTPAARLLLLMLRRRHRLEPHLKSKPLVNPPASSHRRVAPLAQVRPRLQSPPLPQARPQLRNLPLRSLHLRHQVPQVPRL